MKKQKLSRDWMVLNGLKGITQKLFTRVHKDKKSYNRQKEKENLKRGDE
jgi:hypothetical protein